MGRRDVREKEFGIANVIVLSAALREYFRPVIIDAKELYIGPRVATSPQFLNLSFGTWPVEQVLARVSDTYRNADTLVCIYDQNFSVCGLELFRGKKVLILSDMHHMEQPIQRAVACALSEPWDTVIVQYNRNLCHFLAEAGVRNVAWIPNFLISPFDMPPPVKRTRGITFAGGLQCHPYRRWVLQELAKKVPVEVITGVPREQCAKIHNESLISLNISLNGDFNLRNFEIMAAGGFLLTDMLSPQSGQEMEFAESDASCQQMFLNVNHLESLCRYYLDATESKYQSGNSPMEIARTGYDWYWANYSPEKQIERFWKCLNGETKFAWPKNKSDLPLVDRIKFYEAAQELHRNWLPGYAEDIKDLTRWRS